MASPLIARSIPWDGPSFFFMAAEVNHVSGPERELMKANENQSLEQILESAVVVFWADLMAGAQTGLIHIEYGFTAGGTLDYLKVLSSIIRGQWLLACECWMSASTLHSAGVRFHNGYQSEGLAYILESVMQHQTAFSLPADLGRHGLLQIPTPTQEETVAAAALVSEALERVGSTPAHLALA
jgi:hypothetical protein